MNSAAGLFDLEVPVCASKLLLVLLVSQQGLGFAQGYWCDCVYMCAAGYVWDRVPNHMSSASILASFDGLRVSSSVSGAAAVCV